MGWEYNKQAAKKIEDIKRKGTRAYFQEYNKQNSSFTGVHYEINRKGDVFCSGDSCQGIGFGTGESVTSADLDDMENFVRKKRTDFSLYLEIPPYADPVFLSRLQSLGYTMDHFLNVWIIDLTEWQPPAKMDYPNVEIEKVDEENVFDWAWAIALGISNDDYQADISVESVKAFWQVPNNTSFLVKECGKCIGGGCMAIDGEIAELFMTATIPAKRRKGYQALLIDARLSYAKTVGCTFATVTTKPDTSSARNVRRSGFTLAYDKVVLRSPRLN